MNTTKKTNTSNELKILGISIHSQQSSGEFYLNGSQQEIHSPELFRISNKTIQICSRACKNTKTTSSDTCFNSNVLKLHNYSVFNVFVQEYFSDSVYSKSNDLLNQNLSNILPVFSIF